MVTRNEGDGRLLASTGFVAQADAQRNAVPRSQAGTRTNSAGRKAGAATLLLLGAMLALAPGAMAAPGAVLSGMVRDAQGVAQMGALVQVLTADAATVATAFTDLHGRYVIANLKPGSYLVRASATLFVPAVRQNLELRTGATAVVNLTLAALFDTAEWLPAQRRRADESSDDWKWTLRSSANRPILRIVEDGNVIEVSSSATEQQKPVQTRARATVSSGDGEFGQGGVHNILDIHRQMDDGGDMMLRADMGSSRVPSAYAPSQELDAGYERRVGFDGAARTVVSYTAHPELVAAGMPGGLQVFSMTSGERLSLGEELQVEAGGSVEGVHSTRYALVGHPFLRLTAHSSGVWSLHYRMATDRELQGFEDVSTGENAVPVALVKNGRLTLESGRHQEVSIGRKAARGTIEVAYYHDALQQTMVSGGLGGSPVAGASGGPASASRASVVPDGMLVDPTTGSFRALAAGYRTNGARVTVNTPITQGLWVAAEYSTGDALVSNAGPTVIYADALAGLKPGSSQAATFALKGRLMATGTRVRASYRWQPSSVVSAVDPYSAFSDQAFFSCLLRQPIHWGNRLPQGLDATIDVTNLLAEGYRPFLSADGQTLYFAQAPRTIQAGLSFTF